MHEMRIKNTSNLPSKDYLNIICMLTWVVSAWAQGVQLNPQEKSHLPALHEAWSRQQVIAQADWDPGEAHRSKTPLDNGHLLRPPFCSPGTCPKNTIWEPLWSGQPGTPAKWSILHNMYQDEREMAGERERYSEGMIQQLAAGEKSLWTVLMEQFKCTLGQTFA